MTVSVRGWVFGLLSASLAHAQAPLADEERSLAAVPPSRPSRPISDSAARIVEQFGYDGGLGADAKAGCEGISEGVPCFPVSTVKRRPQWATSLRQSLGNLGLEESPSPSRPPTLAELQPYRPGPVGTLIVLGSFDPTCVGKSVLKRLRGKNDAYYLYRVGGPRGEHVALYDHRLTAEAFPGRLEFLGRFKGECKALAAYRHEDRKPTTALSVAH